MMDLLPPVGWGDIATRSDLQALRSDLRGEMAELRGEVRSDLAGVREEMHSMRADLVRSLFFGMVASNATLVGLVLAAVRLG